MSELTDTHTLPPPHYSFPVRRKPLLHAFRKPIPRFGFVRRPTVINDVGQKRGSWLSLVLDVKFVLSGVCVAKLQHVSTVTRTQTRSCSDFHVI